jgi:hypothetical protein
MITGAHMIIYSTDPYRGRDFFIKILQIPNVDIGRGWIIFELRLLNSRLIRHQKIECTRYAYYTMI